MPIDPRTTDDIYESLKGDLTGQIGKLSNFVTTSFNYVWTRAFSEQIAAHEEKLLAAQLSGWVDYAGGPVTEETLEDLSLDYSDADTINSYMADSHLDEMAKLVGVRRYSGDKAVGQVEVTTATDTIEIPEGTKFGTQPGSNGQYLAFFVDADGDGAIDTASNASVTPDSGENRVLVDVIAEGVGEEYNVGSGAISYMPNPPVGVEGVTNPASLEGGDNEQSNAGLREDIKNAISQNSGGGTTAGIQGFIESNVTGVGDGDVIIEEHTSSSPPTVDVVVDGGTNSDVRDAIAAARPAGIRHVLVRPSIQELSIDVELQGADIQTGDVETAIEEYVYGLGLGENFIRDRLIQQILNTDEDIISIDSLTVQIDRVTTEQHQYTEGTDQYPFDVEPEVNGLNSTIYTKTDATYTRDTDYVGVDTDSDGIIEGVDWSVGGTAPGDGDVFFVSYDADYIVGEDWTVSNMKKVAPANISVTTV